MKMEGASLTARTVWIFLSNESGISLPDHNCPMSFTLAEFIEQLKLDGWEENESDVKKVLDDLVLTTVLRRLDFPENNKRESHYYFNEQFSKLHRYRQQNRTNWLRQIGYWT